VSSVQQNTAELAGGERHFGSEAIRMPRLETSPGFDCLKQDLGGEQTVGLFTF
jgi:hypothetical protein